MSLKIFAAAALVFVSSAVTAADSCVTTGRVRTCADANGNTYTTQRFGSLSTTNGANSRTGAQWQSNTQRVGENLSFTNGTDKDGRQWQSSTQRVGENLSFTNGTDANGRPFSLTAQKVGDYTFYSGTDSSGNPVSFTCGPYGCDR